MYRFRWLIPTKNKLQSPERLFGKAERSIPLGRFLSSVDIRQSRYPSSSIKSSLYISPRGELNSVTKPLFDVAYLQNVATNLDSIRAAMQQRELEIHFVDIEEMRKEILEFSHYTTKVNNLKLKRDKLLRKIRKKTADNELEAKFAIIKQELSDARQSFYALEDKVIPFLLAIPAEIRQTVKNTFEELDHLPGFRNVSIESLEKINHIRLGYINNTCHSSIIGPDAKFLIGNGALFFYALNQYLSDLFERARFVPISGLDLVKSALIEAVNDRPAHDDACILRVGSNEEDEFQRLHLVGDASLEALCAWLYKAPAQSVTQGNKWLQVGSWYKSREQQHTIRATILSDDAESDDAMQQLYDLCWTNALQQLGLRARCIRCEASALPVNQSARFDLLAWLHSQRDWLPVGNISHHDDYISRRLGLIDASAKHLISAHLDIMQLLKCAFEHYQDPRTGKVNAPPILNDYLICNE